jgi:hypothetical protein
LIKFEFKPNPINDNGESYPSPFEGTVTIMVPSFTERLEIARQVKYSASNSGELGVRKEEDNLSQASQILKLVEKYIDKIDLKVSNEGIEVKTLEELSHYYEGKFIIEDVTQILIEGVRLGKRLR